MKSLGHSLMVVPVLFASAISVFAQGSLTPPGAPAPTMKSLDQVEARTPISSAPFTITASGSYYLTADLTVASGNAITVNADDVTLDLNGFTISSTASPAGGAAVFIGNGRQNITIRNGHIAGTTTFSGGAFAGGGFNQGVTSLSTNRNIHVADLAVRQVASDAIGIGNSTPNTFVERCRITVAGGSGIRANVVRDCTVETAGSGAIVGGTVSNSVGTSVGTGGGDLGVSCTMAENCRGTADAATGIFATTASNCVGVSNSNSGVNAQNTTNCIGTSTSGIGLTTTNAINCSGTSTSDVGLRADNATNCTGTSTSGSAGMSILGTAHTCRGKRDGGIAISASIAIGCTVNGTGTVSATSKFLGTP